MVRSMDWKRLKKQSTDLAITWGYIRYINPFEYCLPVKLYNGMAEGQEKPYLLSSTVRTLANISRSLVYTIGIVLGPNAIILS